MQKHFLLVIALLVTVGALWYMEKRQAALNPPVVTDPAVEPGQEPTPSLESSYSRHIEAIPGNTDEVWYNIPEYGVRMRLSQEFAEDLIYSFVHEKNTNLNEEWDAVYFSTESLTAVDKGCSPEEGSPLGVITKIKGNVAELAKTDVVYSSALKDIIQVGEYYYMWTGPQATCWNPKNDDAIQRVRGPEIYKAIQDGVKTIQLIPSR